MTDGQFMSGGVFKQISEMDFCVVYMCIFVCDEERGRLKKGGR